MHRQVAARADTRVFRIVRVLVSIEAPSHSNRVTLEIPTSFRIVVSEVIVVKPHFRIIVLTWGPDVVHYVLAPTATDE